MWRTFWSAPNGPRTRWVFLRRRKATVKVIYMAYWQPFRLSEIIQLWKRWKYYLDWNVTSRWSKQLDAERTHVYRLRLLIRVKFLQNDSLHWGTDEIIVLAGISSRPEDPLPRKHTRTAPSPFPVSIHPLPLSIICLSHLPILLLLGTIIST